MNYVINHLGRRDTRWNQDHVAPCEHVADGDHVVAVIDGTPRAVTVICAVGLHARVADHGGAEHWRHVRDLGRPHRPETWARLRDRETERARVLREDGGE